jgi:hypothetical protein
VFVQKEPSDALETYKFFSREAIVRIEEFAVRVPTKCLGLECTQTSGIVSPCKNNRFPSPYEAQR